MDIEEEKEYKDEFHRTVVHITQRCKMTIKNKTNLG